MKILFPIIWTGLLLITNYAVAKERIMPQGFLTGKITDKKTGEPLPGVIIYFPDLKIGTTSDTEGNYKITNLPLARVLVQISYISYRTLLETVDLSGVTILDFQLEYVATEINEIVVTGLTKSTEQKRNPAPVSVVPRLVLLQSASANIIDAIATQPGISQITTGSGISKPVIRGLGYNRVVVVSDGIRQEGQQWGDEHGVEIDEFSVNRVEILKGPASIVYGSDAMAGVINMVSAPPLSADEIRGNLIMNYQTNNGLFGISGNMAGNRKGLVWDLRYSHKMAHAYQNRYDGYVFNSGFKENSLSIMTGLVKSWGYSNLSFNEYSLTPGIAEGNRDSMTGHFTRPVALNDSTEINILVSDHDLKSYTPLTPYQKILHYKIVLNNNFILRNSHFRSTIGFQQNHRQEFGDVLHPGQYELYFLLNTLNYDLRYVLPEFRKYSISFGINGMHQTSRNKGDEFLVPEYTLFDIGTFVLVKKSFGKFDLSGGLRYDSRIENGKDLYLNSQGDVLTGPEPGSVQRFSAFHSSFSDLSGSLGSTWQISKVLYTKLNVSRGYRAPNIAELGSNGIHEGTSRYELGDADLKAESSLQFDYTFGVNGEHISAEADIFHNGIYQYIFQRKLSSALGGDSITAGSETFKFVQGDARLMGGEIRIDLHPHPLDWIHYENTFSYVEGYQHNQPDSSRYLPLIPPPRWQSSLRVDIESTGKLFHNIFVQIESDFFFKQDKYYAAYGTETATPRYILFNLGMGTDIIVKGKTLCSFYVSLNNLTDVTYQSHLSRLKYTDINYATNRVGIYNMGRNISFKLIIPVNII
jgi:iron complex outermembrane recepter protein